MVSQLKKAGESTKSEANKNRDDLQRRASDRVTAAIKSRNDSFTLLKQAAASSFLFGIQYGRFDLFNRLFLELPTIDADALRQKFVWRVYDMYAQGGTRAPQTPDGQETGWLKRPVSFIAYRQNPPENAKNQHFFIPQVLGKTSEAEEKRKLIKAGKAKVIEAGEAGLEAIDWISRDAVIRGDTTYDASNFRKELARVLAKAVRAMKSDPDTRIEPSSIRAIMRDAGFEKKESASINALLEDVANQNRPTVAPTPTASDESEKTPATSEKEAA